VHEVSAHREGTLQGSSDEEVADVQHKETYHLKSTDQHPEGGPFVSVSHTHTNSAYVRKQKIAAIQTQKAIIQTTGDTGALYCLCAPHAHIAREHEHRCSQGDQTLHANDSNASTPQPTIQG